MDIVIIGTGGFAKEVYTLLTETLHRTESDDKFVGFIDDNPDLIGQLFMGASVLGNTDWLIENPNTKVIIAIGNPHIKRKIAKKLSDIAGIIFYTLISPNAIVGQEVRIGKGVIICDGNIITENIEIENFTTFNLACTVGHDTRIEEYATIAPGVNISGNCIINKGADIGTGATIIQGKTIGAWSIIGAGAVVVKDIPTNTTSVGNPAKVIKEREDGWYL